jgi:hypothetical protein
MAQSGGASPHLVVCVASHGWGHLSQTVPIVAALLERRPGLRVTVRTGLPDSLVRARFAAAGVATEVLPDDTEFGFVMHDALRIDDGASLARYRALHAGRRARLDDERAVLRALRADAVFANIGWLPIAAAASLGLPAFGGCSLNWADVLEARHPGCADIAAVVDWMREAYRSADALFALEPGMPFESYPNRVRVAPIARLGRARPGELRAALDAPPSSRVLLAAFGGLPLRIDTRAWRLPAGWHVVASFDGARDAPGVRRFDALGWAYGDVLASADALLAKPGYGTFAEAGFAGRDTLFVPRDDWPESPYLVGWLARHARVAPIGLDAVSRGTFGEALDRLAAQPPRTPAGGDGASEVAAAIDARLDARVPG